MNDIGNSIGGLNTIAGIPTCMRALLIVVP